ncbi:MAG TPA: pyridoxamine 5'-phosphate oxidase family protein [Verrucomicrobiae bacterium]|nr:pyridoxamine 5'-phosphate oxidase family protein [Verrucomicrobiae bacterium]
MASWNDSLVQQLLKGRYIAALATPNPDGSTHMVAVWYWSHETKVYVTTSSRSRKARNLLSTARVSLMIDSRDPQASFGMTIIGTARILTGDEAHVSGSEVHRKYLSAAALADPKVGPVFAAWDDVTIEITPASVISWDMRDLDRHALGGSLGKNPSYLLPLER